MTGAGTVTGTAIRGTLVARAGVTTDRGIKMTAAPGTTVLIDAPAAKFVTLLERVVTLGPIAGTAADPLAAETSPYKTCAATGAPTGAMTNKTETGATRAEGGHMTKAENGGKSIAAGLTHGTRTLATL